MGSGQARARKPEAIFLSSARPEPDFLKAYSIEKFQAWPESPAARSDFFQPGPVRAWLFPAQPITTDHPIGGFEKNFDFSLSLTNKKCCFLTFLRKYYFSCDVKKVPSPLTEKWVPITKKPWSFLWYTLFLAREAAPFLMWRSYFFLFYAKKSLELMKIQEKFF